MKKNYSIKGFALLFIALFTVSIIKAQVTVVTFSYGTISSFQTGTIGTWTVPACVTSITMDVIGAQGGNGSTGTGGAGARMRGVVTVTPGQVLSYLVGKCPGAAGAGGYTYPSGGGGSYVANGANYTTATPIIVAGGGGGGYNNATGVGSPTSTSGTGSNPGTNGGGAPSGSCGGGGGGFYSSGGTSTIYGYTGGAGFQQGGMGGTPNATYQGASYAPGGFGGGAPADYYSSCNYRGGSGGGYSGGSAQGTSLIDSGEAGGSFNSASNQTNTAAYNSSGHGSITFSYVPGIILPITSTPSTAICSGNSISLSASGAVSYTWNTSSNSNSISVSPSTSTSYTVMGTNSVGCTGTSVVNVTVNAGTPTLAINSTTNSVCFGKNITLTASGAYTYTWTNGVTNGVAFTPSVTNNFVVTGQNGCGTSTAAISVTVAPLPVSVLASPTVVCAGSQAVLSAVAQANSYTWQPYSLLGASVAVTPTANTVYTVTASDGTCAGTSTVALAALPVPTITSASSASNVCAGVNVTLTANGGVSYTWTPGNLSGSSVVVTPTAPIAYSVAGSNAVGCLAGSSQVIIVSSSPTLNVTVSDPVICSGGTSSLSASGANTYVWSSGGTSGTEVVNPTQTTTYSVTGTSTVNGCNTTSAVTVQVITPSVTITGNTVVCSGVSATLNANGATSYTWVNSGPFQGITVTPTVTTTYTLNTTTSSGGVNCNATNNIQVVVNPNPVITTVSSRTAMCKGESVTITASGANSYSWTPLTGAPIVASSIVATSSLITTLSYTVTGTDTQGCKSATFVSVKVNGCNGINENNAVDARLQVSPNPSNGEFLITYSKAIRLMLVNELGQTIRFINLDETNNFSYTVSGLSNGVYMLSGTNGGRLNQKIIVAK